MAAIMIRHNTSNGAPPLPARNPPTQAPGGRQLAQTTHGGRRSSEDQSVIHVKLERADRRTPESSSRPKQRSPRDAPEVTSRNNENLCRRREFETQSFVARNTAKVYSDPSSYDSNHHGNQRPVDHVVYPEDENTPPPPPIATLPRKPSEKPRKQSSEQNTDSRQALPTSLPPARPPKTLGTAPPRPPKGSHSSDESSVQSPDRPPKGLTSPTGPVPSRGVPGGQVVTAAPARPPKLSKGSSEGSYDENPAMTDLENRFCFHNVSEFPDPEPMSIHNKRMPSMSRSFRKVDQQERIGYL